MNPDQTFRAVLIIMALILFPVAVYHRVKSQATGERLDRWQEGRFILFTLRPIGIATQLGLLAYMINPELMAWSSMRVPVWARWFGVALGVMGGSLFVWTFRNLGKNLTDTVVTRRDHTLVTSGPYRWVRHPFYDAAALFVVANALVAANWFLLLGGVFAIILIVIRTRREEERLLARFGETYRAYVAQTPRFLPRVRLTASAKATAVKKPDTTTVGR